MCHASCDLIAICDGNDEECIEPANTHPDDNDPADLCDISAKCDDNDDVCTKPININSDDNDPAAHLTTFICKHAKNLIISHYNINSIRYKFSELQHILHGNFVDILGIAETKIDASLFDGQFQVNNYKLYRQDRNDRGGGIMMYINDNIPHRLLKQFSGIYHGIDYLTFEIIVKSRKWYISYLYRPPNVNESILCGLLNVLSEEFISNNNLYIAYGDLNCNWFKHNALSDLCEIYGMVNLIEPPTCFKGDNLTLVDVFLTNRPKCFSGVCNTDLGTSDFHNCICVSSRMFAPSHSKHMITYRSMKHLSESAFQNGVDFIPIHVCDIFDDIDDVYWMHDKLFMSVLDKHAPVKTKTVNTQVPYMNSTLRKAINQRDMWRSKHFRNRDDKQLRMKYVMWRNHVVKLHKNSIRNYFTHRCNDNVGSKNFYKTIKPFLSTKQSHYSGSKIVLKENDSIISDVSKVADIFNMFYESIAEYKFQSDGLDNLDFDEAIMKHASHTSISLIKQSISRNYEFSFSPISVQSMSKYISLLKSNKAVGHDGLHAAFLTCSVDNMSTSLCNVFNACISSCDFPSTLKWADINPIYKKKDNLCKENYRSVNVLAVVSKVFERVLSDQLMAYFVSILNHSLSAYRAGYSYQHVIL